MDADTLARAIGQYRADPAMFVRDVLKVEPYPHQAEIMQAVADKQRRISIRSGRRIGKTTTMAWLTLWYLMTRADARVIVTAPSSAQLQDAFVPEFRKHISRLPPELMLMWDVKQERFDFRPPRAPFENYCTVRTARSDSPESLQGINAPHVLILVDEASGVGDVNFEALSGSMGTDNATMCLTGNPVRSEGYFYQTHTTLRDRWKTLHVSSEDVPSVSRDWIEEMEVKYGRESNAFRVHVAGEFPTADDDTVIPLHLVQAARERDIQISPNVPVIWGLDVARFGDDASVLRKRKGKVVLPDVRKWRNLDTMQLAGAIKIEFDQTPREDRPEEILVDVIGIGAGVVDRLRELDMPVRGINVSESPAVNGSQYLNLRSELWHKLLEWLMARDCSLPEHDENLSQELTVVRRDYTSSGKVKIESKKDMRRRGVASPDDADALVLTFASTAATLTHGRRYPRKSKLRRNIRGVV